MSLKTLNTKPLAYEFVRFCYTSDASLVKRLNGFAAANTKKYINHALRKTDSGTYLLFVLNQKGSQITVSIFTLPERTIRQSFLNEFKTMNANEFKRCPISFLDDAELLVETSMAWRIRMANLEIEFSSETV